MRFEESLKNLDYQIKVCEEQSQKLSELRRTLEELLKQGAKEMERWRIVTEGLEVKRQMIVKEVHNDNLDTVRTVYKLHGPDDLKHDGVS